MTTLIHVLGSDIPHHNQTLLRFFHDVLATQLPAPLVTHFIVVSGDEGLQQAFPGLTLTGYADKRALAQAVVTRARAVRQTQFFFHGQFNPWI